MDNLALWYNLYYKEDVMSKDSLSNKINKLSEALEELKKAKMSFKAGQNLSSPSAPKAPTIKTAPSAQKAPSLKETLSQTSTKDPVKVAEQLKDPGLVKETVKLSKNGQWSLEKKKPSFNPREARLEDGAEMRDGWTTGESEHSRQNMPRMEGSARQRAISKLTGSTKYRRNPETNALEFLMHRGMSQKELDANHRDGSTRYLESDKNGWTPKINVAHDFGVHGHEGGKNGHVVSAWIPESQLHSSMRQYGGKSTADQNLVSSEDEWIVDHSKPFSHHGVVPANKDLIKEELEVAPEGSPNRESYLDEFEKKEKPFHGYNSKKHSREGGLSESYRKKYNRETGSNLQKPVTSKEAKKSDKKAGRRKSFCARMSGVKGPTSKDGKLTRKGAALKRWDC